jgi:hypothetical protein
MAAGALKVRVDSPSKADCRADALQFLGYPNRISAISVRYEFLPYQRSVQRSQIERSTLARVGHLPGEPPNQDAEEPSV